MKLSKQERALYSLLANSANKDVLIADVHCAIYPSSHVHDGEKLTVRRMQQRIGSCISRINAKLPDGKRIVPGSVKQTYQLRIEPKRK